MIRRPRLGQITQGTVFCGAIAENYDDVPVWGVVITARCDTAHDKAPVINYLPIVRVEDWLCRQGGLIIADRAFSNAMSGFKNLLIQRQLSPSLLDVYNPADLVSVHFKPISAGAKAATKDAKECAQAVAFAGEIARMRAILDVDPPKPSVIGAEVRRRSKLLQTALKELLSYQLPGYYYIPSMENLTEKPSDHGYVVILREVRHVTARTGRLLTKGITREDDAATTAIHGLTFGSFDFVYPIAEIQSPWIEHLMQAFCGLFGRIGVDDHDKSKVATIVAALVTMEGTET